MFGASFQSNVMSENTSLDTGAVSGTITSQIDLMHFSVVRFKFRIISRLNLKYFAIVAIFLYAPHSQLCIGSIEPMEDV